MKSQPFAWRTACARAVALGVVVVLAPWPVTAEPIHSAPSPVDLKAAIQKVAATERLASTPAATARDRTQSTADPNLQSPSFFKTPLGLAVIAIVGAGTGYALYSAQHDRIHSTAR